MTYLSIDDILVYSLIAVFIFFGQIDRWLLEHHKGTRRTRLYVYIGGFTIGGILLSLAVHLPGLQVVAVVFVSNIIAIISYYLIVEPLDKFFYGHSDEKDIKNEKK